MSDCKSTMNKNLFLTGIQCTGSIHLGNILSVIIPTIELSNDNDKEVLAFIADLHTLTTLKDKHEIENNILYTTAIWLACGLDTQKVILYQQSQIKELCKFSWELSCLAPYPMLANAHAFKDKAHNLADVNVGLFTYPVLMAADILIVNANYVIVGKDQKQHIEIARDIAHSYNKINDRKLIIPEAYILKDVDLIPGTDGRKMSKSYKNGIDIFADEDTLRKQIFSIRTDSKGEGEVKNPDTCIVFKIYSCIAEGNDIEIMRDKYTRGAIGYKEAKETLLELILARFKTARENFNEIKNEKEYLKKILHDGSQKVQTIIGDR